MNYSEGTNTNTRTITPSAASAVIAAIILTLTLASAMASQSPDEDLCTIIPDITNHAAGQHVSNATRALQLAPLNPDFVAYQKRPLGTSGDHICGYMPPSMDLSHLDDIPVERLQAPGVLPGSFDWRDSGNVTPVKDQASCGTCWTFGTTSVLESVVLINEGVEYNFSEQSVALCVDRSWTRMYDGADEPCDAGGNGFIASEVFIKKGSILELCNPYNGSALNCAGSCVCDDCAPVKRVDGYRLVTDNGSEIDVIKSAVYDHGPVIMSFYWHSSGNYTNATWGFIYDYYPSPGFANHMVSIIGWNDSVPHPNPGHDGTGAWIVKNSWGTGWGNDGFFYLAYNSSCVRGVAYLEYKDSVPGEELLYWDEAGFVGSVDYGNSSNWMASVFTANQSGNLTHVDFWTTSNNAEYEVYVWNGFFGSELANQTGTCQEYGYYSIPLDTPISLDAGQQFTIGVNMTTPGYDCPIPVEYEIAWTVNPTIQSNVSFIRQNASDSWMDMANYNWTACLRARVTRPPNITSFAPETPVRDEPNATRTFNITIYQTVDVTWLINGTIMQDTNTSVVTASYTTMSATPGVWNVSAVVESANGDDMQTWIWNVTPRVPGDVTGNGDVNIGDAALLFNWVSFPNKRETAYALNRADNADVTGNGVINIGDAVLLFNWVSFENERGATYVLK